MESDMIERVKSLLQKHSWTLTLTGVVAISIIAWYGHAFYDSRFNDPAKLSKPVRESSVVYKFIQPFLFTDNDAQSFHELGPLKAKLSEYHDEAVRKNQAEEVGIYFRDLNTLSWTGVDEDTLFNPASLNKVILLLAYLQAAENDSSILSKNLWYDGNTDSASFYQVAHSLQKGRYYPVRDLLLDMIVKSGNDSTATLFNSLDKQKLAAVYKDIGLPFPEEDKPELISPKMYSRLFRVLYGSTYLGRESSNQALDVLSQTEFNKGLTAPLPAGIQVSHKFGEYTELDANGNATERELHDCGIVYAPNHPYFLCIMTKGMDFSKLEGVIKDVSTLVYQEEVTSSVTNSN